PTWRVRSGQQLATGAARKQPKIRILFDAPPAKPDQRHAVNVPGVRIGAKAATIQRDGPTIITALNPSRYASAVTPSQPEKPRRQTRSIMRTIDVSADSYFHHSLPRCQPPQFGQRYFPPPPSPLLWNFRILRRCWMTFTARVGFANLALPTQWSAINSASRRAI